MSDVYKTQYHLCNNSSFSHNDGQLSMGQIFIIISVSASLASMIFVLIVTFCSAIKVARQLSSRSDNADANTEPDVIIVEECKDLQSQPSVQLTLNSRELLEYYDKLPSSSSDTAGENLQTMQM